MEVEKMELWRFVVVGLIVLFALKVLEEGSEWICEGDEGGMGVGLILGFWWVLGLVGLALGSRAELVSAEILWQALSWFGVGVLGMSVKVVEEKRTEGGLMLAVEWVLRLVWWIGGLGLMWWVLG